MIESIGNALWLASMDRGVIDRQPRNLVEELSSCVSQGFVRGLPIEEAWIAFADFHSELDDDELTALSEHVFAWLVESFACYLAETDDLEEAFGEFCERHQLSDIVAQDLADYIQHLASDDDDDESAITFPDEAGLDQDARVDNIKQFLHALARAIGDNSQPLFPDLKLGDKPDPYGNRWGEKAKPVDREKNRYGAKQHMDEGVARVLTCLNNMDRLWTSTNCNEQAADGFRKAQKRNKDDNNQ